MSIRKISTITHPDYDTMLSRWDKFRLVYEGGKNFIDKHLVKFSTRESDSEFEDRKNISYAPSHAKSAIIDIKNAIYQRLVDVTRDGGTSSYQQAIKGAGKGVDLQGNTINGFVGRVLLPELLSMGKVGIFIDQQDIEENSSKADNINKHPYLYHFITENIRSWSYDSEGNLTHLLLKDYRYIYADDLVKDKEEYYKLFVLEGDNIKVEYYNKVNELFKTSFITLPKIPFVIFEISQSLLVDVADYQIALLNLASSDMHICKTNFPFYVEQINPASLFQPEQATGTEEETKTAATASVNVGAKQGRRYLKGLDQPAFIHPSSEPLRASMEKQSKLEKEIRQLVNLNITNLEPRRESADSKQMDERGLEAGLSYIGLELEYGERLIAQIWAMYEKSKATTTITYPKTYSLKTDKERREEAKELNELSSVIPSLTYQKAVAKQIASILVGHKVSIETMDTIEKEIMNSPVINIDPDIIQQDHEAGFVSTELASQLRMYPKGQVEQAKKDHAERASRIALAQSKASARGVADLGADDPNMEKETSQSADINDIPAKKVRS